MALLCLADSDISDLKESACPASSSATPTTSAPVTAGDLHAQGAMTALLRRRDKAQSRSDSRGDARSRPRRSVRQHRARLQLRDRDAARQWRLGDYAVTEAGFGADLGAEKFLDIKCRLAGLSPVGGRDRGDCARAEDARRTCRKASSGKEDLAALEAGLPNLLRHVKNIREVYRLPRGRGGQPLPDGHRRGDRRSSSRNAVRSA